MSRVRASEAGIMRSKGRTRGLIPRAGSAKAASFARDRAKQLMGVSRSLLRAKKPPPEFIAESRFRFVPAHGKIVGPRGRTAGGKGFPMEGGRIVQVPAGTREVGGFRAFPDFQLLPSIRAGAQVRLATGTTRFGKGQELVDIKGLKRDLNRILALTGLPHIGARYVVWHVGRWSLMEIVWKTPIETGQAAGGWAISPQLRGKRGYGRVGFRIKNPVPYVIFLEHGHSQKAPEGMMGSTFMEARFELRNLMDVLIDWWKEQRYLLRNMRFDYDLAAGVAYDPAQLERKIPNLVWQRLIAELKTRLPLNRPVAELNANMYLAMRIDDPKDWHTVSEFEERQTLFEAHVIKTTSKKSIHEVGDVPVEVGGTLETHEMIRQVGTRETTTRRVVHSIEPNEIPLDVTDLAQQESDLERKWGGR